MANPADRYSLVRRLGAALGLVARPAAEAAIAVVTGDAAPATIGHRLRGAGDGIMNVVSGLGTSSDKRTFTQYIPGFALDQFTAETLYENWIFAKIVDTLPKDMVREGFELSWDGLDKSPDDRQTVLDAYEDFQARSLTLDALKWSRLYGLAFILIWVKGEDMATPLNLDTIRKGSLQCLLALDRWRCSPSGILDTTPGPNLGKPVFYTVAESGLQVHWTRLIAFHGRRLPRQPWLRNGYSHGSVLSPVIDTIRDFDTTAGGIASMVFEANLDIIGVEGLWDYLGDNQGEANLIARFSGASRMKSFNRMLLVDKDKEEYHQKVTQLAGANETLREFKAIVAGAAEMPQTMLWGQSPGGLNSTGDHDAENWNRSVAAAQTNDLKQQDAKLLGVIARSTLGVLPKKFKHVYKPLSVMSATEKATIEKTKAERDKIYVDMGALTEGAVTRQLKEDGTYSTLEENDVKMAEELSKEPPAAPPPFVPPAAPATSPVRPSPARVAGG